MTGMEFFIQLISILKLTEIEFPFHFKIESFRMKKSISFIIILIC